MSWPFNTALAQIWGPNDYKTLINSPLVEDVLWSNENNQLKAITANFANSSQDGTPKYMNLYSMKENLSVVFDYGKTVTLGNYYFLDNSTLSEWYNAALTKAKEQADELEMMDEMFGGGGGAPPGDTADFKSEVDKIYNSYNSMF